MDKMIREAMVAAAIVGTSMSIGSVASATVIPVTTVNGMATKTSWGTLPGENTGTVTITGTSPRDGDGSIELRGDRTRVQIGVQYGGATGATNLMQLSSVTGLSFDWRIAGDSVNGYNPDYTPALRLLVQDGNVRSELIWEGVYNGTYGNTARDTWYSTSFSDSFYQFVAGQGVTTVGGQQVNKTLASWIATNYSSAAFVSGISVGDGSGALATYHAFADNVTLGTTTGATTYNFDLPSSTAAVPEPATWAMVILGMGAVGYAIRRRQKFTTRVSYAG